MPLLTPSKPANPLTASLVMRCFLGLATIAIGTSAYFSYRTLRNATLGTLQQSALAEVKNSTQNLDHWLGNLETRVEMLANTETARTANWEIAGPYLKAEHDRTQDFAALSLATPDGTRYSTVAKPVNVSDRKWFQTAMAGHIYIDDPVISRASGLPIVPISAPIINPQNHSRPLGVILGSVNVDRLREVAMDLKFGNDSYTFILNSTGQAIIHPQAEFMSSLEKPAPSLTQSKEADLAKIAQKMIARTQGIELAQINGQQVYVAFVPLQQASWSIALVMPQENIDSQLQLLDQIAMVMLGLAGALVLLLIYVQSIEKVRVKQREAAEQQQVLESRVVERTQELNATLEQLKASQLQLIQSEKMSALGGLVAGVAHEINNPVSFLVGNIEPAQNYINHLFGLLDLYASYYPQPEPAITERITAIELDYLREDLPKVIGSMQLGAERISAISQGLRTFSRSDNDALVTFDLHAGLESTLLILKHRLKANGVRPDIKVVKHYGNLHPVTGYAGQLNQVFMNILANAIDAMEEANQGKDYAYLAVHPNQITVTTETIEQADHLEVVVRIRDNGVGMAEAVKQRIFEHLFTMKPVGKGTGLGLAIVQQIVAEKHGGRVEVNTVLGEGTEFVIYLPQERVQTENITALSSRQNSLCNP